MKCYACQGTGRNYTVIGGIPTTCQFCAGTKERDPCGDFTVENPRSAPYPTQPCTECGHLRPAH